jgi:hypothetical protein
MTVSEIHFESPSDRLSNIHDDDGDENDLLRHLSEEIEKEEKRSSEQPSKSLIEDSPRQLPPKTKPRSNTGSDRRRFKGVLSDMIYRTKKDNYVRDGQEMLKTHQEVKSSD